jgi:hypothetical protein
VADLQAVTVSLGPQHTHVGDFDSQQRFGRDSFYRKGLPRHGARILQPSAAEQPGRHIQRPRQPLDGPHSAQTAFFDLKQRVLPLASRAVEGDLFDLEIL